MSSKSAKPAAKAKCHLLNLPPELRLAIFEFYFARVNLVKPKTINIVEGDLFRWTATDQDLTEPPLLSVSSRVRSEALEPYLKELQKASVRLLWQLHHRAHPGYGIPPRPQEWFWSQVPYNEVYLGGQSRVVRQKVEKMKQEMKDAKQSHA